MNYASIKYNDIANGTGVRTSLWVSGCNHHCKNCFNQEAWDFDYGEEFTDAVLQNILVSLQPTYINGLTILGGEPLDPLNIKQVCEICKEVKAFLPDKTIWLYTGYKYEDLLVSGEPYVREIFKMIDVLVDGPYIEAENDGTTVFKGSKNQRILDMHKTEF